MAGQPFQWANGRPIWLVEHTRTREMHSWNKRDTRGPFYHCLYSYKSSFLKEREKIFRRESKRFIWSKTYSLTILKASQEEEKFGSTLALEIAPWNKLFKASYMDERNWRESKESSQHVNDNQNSSHKFCNEMDEQRFTTWLDMKHFIRKSSKMQIGSGGSDTHRGRRLGKENATGGLGWRHDFLH